MGVRRNVRILLVGEREVGKTSLILSLVSEEFNEDVPSKAEEITIPADITPEQVPTHIVDFSAADQTDEQLGEEIQRAHVICVVYSVEDEDSLEKVTSYWLPLIRECSSDNRCPIVLVGNKCDLIEDSTIDLLFPIMEDFPEIESCVECSAKTLKNISEMFFYAQKAVLHPTAPIYSMDNQNLTEGCKNALVRVFKLCDLDNDGVLNDKEMNTFQSRCFNAPLQQQVLDEVKAVISKNVSDGIRENSITLNGFIFLHCLFVQRGRNETTWTVLRKFGYSDKLELTKEYLHPTIRVPPSSTTELSQKGTHFLTALFERHDKDCDGALSPSELKSLFSVCPAPAWTLEAKDTVPTNSKGWITLKGFLCQWVFITLCDLPKSFEYLAYFGYNTLENESQLTAVQVTREKQIDIVKKQTCRNVYQCHVIGSTRSGKSTLCRNFIGYSLEESIAEEPIANLQCTTNMIYVYGQEKYLVLRDINVRHVSDPLYPSEVQCDVACLLYDSTNPASFEYIARIYLKYFADSKIPVLVVASKCDLSEMRQDYLLQPGSFCSRHKLSPPQLFTASGQPKPDLFIKLGTMAAFPHLSHMNLLSGDPAIWWKAGLGIALLAAMGFMVVRAFNGDKRL